MEEAAVAFANAVSHKDDTSGKKDHIGSGDFPGPAIFYSINALQCPALKDYSKMCCSLRIT